MNELRPITKVDILEARLVAWSGEVAGVGKTCALLPVRDYFAPGLYLREVLMPKGAFVVSKKHKTEHPFIVSRGIIRVWDEQGGAVEIEAPYQGITLPGTKRVLYSIEDTVWTTVHLNPKNLRDIAELEREIIEENDNPLLVGIVPMGVPTIEVNV